jgi:hypothetical protein
MSYVGRRVLALPFAFALLAGTPSPAAAQWYAVGFFGGNHTKPADLRVTGDAGQLDATFHDVRFEARPLQSPQYYGGRVGHLFGAGRRFGIEGEFIHLKIYSLTEDTYDTTGHLGDVDLASIGPLTMNSIVQRYSMTHGLNFVLINAVLRHPLKGEDGPIAFIGRAGAGPTFAHAETTVLNVSRQQYEWAGAGVHGAAGLDVRMGLKLSAVIEYKITYARPEISIPNGIGRATALTHQVAAGLAFGLSR